MNPAADSLTVLHSPWLRLAKRLRVDGGADGYDRAKTLDAYTMPVANLAGIEGLLRRLLPQPSCCIVRGELVHGLRAKAIRRLLYTCKETGELPNFKDVPRRWLALDLDGVPMPDGLAATDLAGCGAAALAVLPQAFHGAECIIQASASHGRAPGLRLRVWVWLSRPTWGAELVRWLKPYPCDRSVFGAVQPIYTAAPALALGVVDPVPNRLQVLPGRPVVDVPPPETLAPPPVAVPQRSSFVSSAARGNAYVRAALVRGGHRISTTAPGGRHPTIVGETCRLARFVADGHLTASAIAEVVRAAAKHAGKDDEAEVDAAIAYGLANPWTAGRMPEDVQHGR